MFRSFRLRSHGDWFWFADGAKFHGLVHMRCSAGCTQAIYFSSLDAAVKGLPELSLLASQLDIVAPTLAAQLRAPTFVGTLFAPTNDVSILNLEFRGLLAASLLRAVLDAAECNTAAVT